MTSTLTFSWVVLMATAPHLLLALEHPCAQPLRVLAEHTPGDNKEDHARRGAETDSSAAAQCRGDPDNNQLGALHLMYCVSGLMTPAMCVTRPMASFYKATT